MKRWLDCSDGITHAFGEANADGSYGSLCRQQFIDAYLYDKLAVEEDNPAENLPNPCSECVERSGA